MADFYAIPTNIGEAKLANALALGVALNITELAVGDGQGAGAQGTPVPDPEQTALVSERRRAPINTLATDPENANVLVAEQVIPEDVGGWWIREMGLFDEDGDLIAVCNTPPTYKPVLASGSGRTQVVRMQIIVTDTTAVTLKVDPAVVLATRQHVIDVMAAHEASRNHPAATTAAQGMVELATEAEAAAGEDKKRAVTPSGVRAAIDTTANDRLQTGDVIMHYGSTPRVGTLELDGAGGLSRQAYAALWEEAQARGLVVTEAEWQAGATGLFSDGDGATTFRLPDWRGEFLRGWDHGRGVDAGRTLGSQQAHDFEAHAHLLTRLQGGNAGSPDDSTGFALTYYATPNKNDGSGSFAGAITYGASPHGGFDTVADQQARGQGLETRPRNVAVMYCIKY
jgi:phage-related tail fiber protein